MGHHHCHEKECEASHHHHECCSGGHENSCGCCCHQEEQCFSEKLLVMADEAWMELLKEKIKKKIDEATGQHLDQLATLVSKANHTRWNNKMGISKMKEEYKDQIANFFHG